MRPIISRGRTAFAAAATCVALAACTGTSHTIRGRSPSAGHALARTATTATTATPITAIPTTTTTVVGASDGCGPPSPDILVPSSLPTTAPTGRPWPDQIVVSGTCPQVVDFGVDAAFSLVSQTPDGVGPWRLERVDLDRATTESGPTFPVGTLDVASGYIWISCGRSTDPAAGPLLCQVDPRTLAVVRQIQLPPTGATFPGTYPPAIADGPDNTIWAGYDQTLVRIGAQDGAILSVLHIASGTVDNLSVDPSQLHLYVSLSHPTVSGKAVDASVLEFAASTGRVLAGTSADSPVTGSVAGGALTAVPGGVWVSFRGGMAGETILLRQSDLAMTGPSSAQMNVPFPDSVFHWMMAASTVYGRATLVLVNEAGLLACIDPQSAVVRVQEDLTGTRGATELLAVDGGSARVLVTDSAGLESVTPPPACWK